MRTDATKASKQGETLDAMDRASSLKRHDSRMIIHFDYDCFYASVFEAENPALKNQPLAVQQKQIIVTCNYEARRRGLYKLQLITEAKKVCPDVVIVLGEDLTRFRNASKELYSFLRKSIWSGQAERLGFDEVFLDCTDMVNYNIDILNHNDLSHSFFCLDQNDPTIGFQYDASEPFGPTYPPEAGAVSDQDLQLYQRLVLGSHLARYLRHELENEKGYTATVGISTNKILSKLVGNLHKPKSQTTLVPPYDASASSESHVTTFMDSHDIGRIPGIGFKLSQKIRARILGRQPAFDEGLVYGGTKEKVTVRDVRTFLGMGPEMLEEILSGPGSQRGIGGKIWGLIQGVDDVEVSQAKKVPSQISIEDSYTRLDTLDEVRKKLNLLSNSLIRRMHLDLMEDDDDAENTDHGISKRRWLAHPRTLRLTTRPRPAVNPDGTRSRSFNRVSRSLPMPTFAFSLTENVHALADRLVQDSLIPCFRKLHPERSGWNLSLVNVAVTNMAETAADSKDSKGRDISRMFRRQDDVLKEWRIVDEDVAPHLTDDVNDLLEGSVDEDVCSEATPPTSWESDEEVQDNVDVCGRCGLSVPSFALLAHERFHQMPD
ncbi:hypothetical protein EPUS_03422 [Endocarpon pusillum Z07020]|uniref:UmuC domain-containing protein n=1 Tax=Endocarpon pusillum (strain Z07020 / HMAS-L-300199) TaxID=1263415 RepID=U1G9R9_ENDPU|nr:uncharacterized protein EPUS_03422 [Endocarpon pusillum Z07020]ERF74232.1 hypothetical protein EPUS_03422 [Endocarpon pusillum Z07020]